MKCQCIPLPSKGQHDSKLTQTLMPFSNQTCFFFKCNLIWLSTRSQKNRFSKSSSVIDMVSKFMASNQGHIWHWKVLFDNCAHCNVLPIQHCSVTLNLAWVTFTLKFMKSKKGFNHNKTAKFSSLS